MRRTLATYREAEDLINIGAYVQGSNPEIDYAITKNPLIQEFVQQGMNEQTSLKECEERLLQIFGDRLEDKTAEEGVA
jgi:flagellum-specific ATP synthase